MATGSFLHGHHTHQSSFHTSNYPCIHPRTQKQQASRMVTELCQTPWHVLLWILPRAHTHTHTHRHTHTHTHTHTHRVTKWHTHTLLHGDTHSRWHTHTSTTQHTRMHTHNAHSDIYIHSDTPTPTHTQWHTYSPNHTSTLWHIRSNTLPPCTHIKSNLLSGMHISASKSTQQVTTGGWQLDKRNSLTCFVGAVQRIVLSHHENLGPEPSILLLCEQQGKDLHPTYTQHIHMLGKIKHKQLCWLQPDQP